MSLLNIIILAAGQGKRMRSQTPKVLHKLGGLSLLERVIHTAQLLNPQNIYVVYGPQASDLPEQFSHWPVQWILQTEPLGTGHAVLQAIGHCDDHTPLLTLYGDVPLISSETLINLIKHSPEKGLSLITTHLKDPYGFGRVLRNADGQIIKIVEEKDAQLEEKKINEVNTGIMSGKTSYFKAGLAQLNNHNQQQEYYLTDMIAFAHKHQDQIVSVSPFSEEEMLGVNDRWQLAQLERLYQQRVAKQFAAQGVTIIDPARLEVRGNLQQIEIAEDVILDINVILSGKIKIGRGSKIGPHVILKDVELGEDVIVEAFSVIEGAIINNQCQIGPFARIRPGTDLAEQVKIGNFVEVKKTKMGIGSKANHLAYLGDSEIGKAVNIGAGTITCNYDGVNKWATSIGDNVFIGSNTSLVAPVIIADGGTIGAGSTITKDTPKNKLTLGRAKQVTIERWERPRINKKT